MFYKKILHTDLIFYPTPDPRTMVQLCRPSRSTRTDSTFDSPRSSCPSRIFAEQAGFRNTEMKKYTLSHFAISQARDKND